MLTTTIEDLGLPSGAEIDAEVERLAVALGIPPREPASTWRYEEGKWIEIPPQQPAGQRYMHNCDKCRAHAEHLIDWLRDDMAGLQAPRPTRPECWTTPEGEDH